MIDMHIVPSLRHCDEILVVGTHRRGDSYRYLHVADLTKTTNDALVKRDVGTLATDCDILVYLSDDHRLCPDFVPELRRILADGVTPWDVLVPSRWTEHPDQGFIRIPNGETEKYCAGHGGVFRRRVIQNRPWSAQQHHRNWDLISSHDHLRAGYSYVMMPTLRIEDLEPWAEPWR